MYFEVHHDCMFPDPAVVFTQSRSLLQLEKWDKVQKHRIVEIGRDLQDDVVQFFAQGKSNEISLLSVAYIGL